MILRLRTLFFFVLLFTFNISFALNNKYELIETSKLIEVSRSRQWNKLLHIEKNFIGVKNTQISDPAFFLSTPNNSDPLQELQATLNGFTEPASKYEKLIDPPTQKLKATKEKITDHSEHPICRFPARLNFLKRMFSNEQTYWDLLPKVNCTFQQIFTDAMDASSVSFVFSSYYSDSPGSAFGHTFFRINRKSNISSKQELLDYGVGYAANVTTNNGFLYAIGGLVGGFHGSWTNLPYYYKVREYNDYEARDLWSYDLDLNTEEVSALVNHLWEIGPHYYTYYFFTQNCAYHMLTTIEAAAPRLNLIEHVPFYYVIPSDSMKALFKENGLVKNVSYRPSLRKTFIDRAKRLDENTKNILSTFSKTHINPNFGDLTDKDKSYLFDAEIDLLDLQNPKLISDEKSDSYKLKEQLLSERANINYVSEEIKSDYNINDSPHLSHGSSRLGLSYINNEQIKLGNLSYRFALHDLLDPTQGLPGNSELEFFNFTFQLKPSELQLTKWSLFKVFNLNPIQFFEKKLSWGIDLGSYQDNAYCGENKDCNLAGVKGRLGYSVQFINYQTENTTWLLTTLNTRYSQYLSNSSHIYFAPGFEFGTLFRFENNISALITYNKEFPSDLFSNETFEVQIKKNIMNKYNIGISAGYHYYGASFFTFF